MHGVNISTLITLIESSKRSESSVNFSLWVIWNICVCQISSKCGQRNLHTPEGSNLDIVALDLEHPVLDAGTNISSALDLDLRTNVSDI